MGPFGQPWADSSAGDYSLFDAIASPSLGLIKSIIGHAQKKGLFRCRIGRAGGNQADADRDWNRPRGGRYDGIRDTAA